MKIDFIFSSSGCVGTLIREAHLDTASLPSEEAEKIKKIIKESDFFHLKTEQPYHYPCNPQVYAFTVTEEGTKHEFTCHSYEVPEKLKPLVEILRPKLERRGGV